MPHQIEVRQQAQKAMARLPQKDQARTIMALQKRAEDPRPQGCRLVKDTPKRTCRIRVGSYRVIHTVVDADQVIIVPGVAERDESAYRGLN